MDIRQLRYFMEVSRQKNFNRAADALFISQQGLSMSILRLEAELSCKLFKRAGKEHLTLTEQGEFLYARAEEIVRQFALCEEYFEKNKKQEKSICIASAYGIMPDYAGKMVFDFQLEHTNTLISMKECPDKLCESMVDSDEAELGFTLGPVDSKRFDSWFLFSRNYCLVVHNSHPFAAEKTASVEMFRSEPVIAMNEDFKMHHILINRCKREGFRPDIRFPAGEIAAVHRLVNLNYGIGLSVEKVAFETMAPNICVLPFDDPEMTWSAYLIKKRGGVLSEAAKAFLRYVIRHSETELSADAGPEDKSS